MMNEDTNDNGLINDGNKKDLDGIFDDDREWKWIH